MRLRVLELPVAGLPRGARRAADRASVGLPPRRPVARRGAPSSVRSTGSRSGGRTSSASPATCSRGRAASRCCARCSSGSGIRTSCSATTTWPSRAIRSRSPSRSSELEHGTLLADESVEVELRGRPRRDRRRRAALVARRAAERLPAVGCRPADPALPLPGRSRHASPAGRWRPRSWPGTCTRARSCSRTASAGCCSPIRALATRRRLPREAARRCTSRRARHDVRAVPFLRPARGDRARSTMRAMTGRSQRTSRRMCSRATRPMRRAEVRGRAHEAAAWREA